MTGLIEVQARDFLLPGCLGVASTLLKLVTLLLFLPLVFGLLGGDFSRLDRILPLSSIFGSDDTQTMIWSLSSAILLAALLSGICEFAANMQVARRGEKARATISRKLINAYLRYGQQYFDLNRLGRILAKTARLPQRGEQLVRFLNTLFKAALALSLYLLVMAWFSPPLTLLVIVVLFIYQYAFNRVSAKIDTLDDLASDAEDEVSAVASDYILNLSLLQLTGAENQARRAFNEAEAVAHLARLEEGRVEAVINPLREMMTMVVILIFAVVTSKFIAFLDVEMVSRYIVFFLLFRRSMGHFSIILSAPLRWSNLQERFARLFELLRDDDKYVVPTGIEPFSGLGSGVDIRRLNFSYVGKSGVLQDVSLTIPTGQRTMIVGSTGSGKSTLFRLLLRQYDCPADSIFVNGTDIRALDTSQWLRHVAYAGAHPRFLNDTIRNNLTIGLQNIDEKALEAAAGKALALEFIQQLEHGFEQTIGDQGALLSSGEQQRLALARLFLLDAELVLLDEATSALDSVTEAQILQSIDEYAAGRTLVMIAHRLSSLREGDHVIVFRNGQVAEQGSRDQLLSAGGALARLWEVHEGSLR